jgi:hypothetical protein
MEHLLPIFFSGTVSALESADFVTLVDEQHDNITYSNANPTTHTTEELIPCSMRARHMIQYTGDSISITWDAKSASRPIINGMRRLAYRSENIAIGIVAFIYIRPDT